MNELTDTQKTLLAMLKTRNPERYKMKLEQYGVQENDILESIHKEQERRLALKLIKRASFTKPKNSEPVGHEYYMGGKPYWSKEPLPQNTCNSVTKQATKSPATTILIIIDGDNHVYKAIEGFEKARRKADIEVYVTDDNLAKRLKEKYGIYAKIVEPGPQAVDNRIKGIAGDQAKRHKYKQIVIISHDKGYDGKIKEWKIKYHYKPRQLKRVESIKEAFR